MLCRFVPCCHSSILLEQTEIPLDLHTLLVGMLVVISHDFAILPRRDDRLCSSTSRRLDELVAVLPLVCQGGIGMDGTNHRLGLRHVGLLTLGQDDQGWVAESVGGGVHFSTQTARGTAECLRSLPPFLPAAC